MKKNYILLFLFFVFVINNCFLYYYKDNTPYKEEINDLSFGYESKVKLNSIIETDEDVVLDTSSLGNKTYENDKYIINYKVEDKTPPLILGGNVSVTVNKKVNLVNKFLCGDNLDDTPNCYIEGEYDFNTVGTYNLKYIAIDSNNNKSTKKFKLKVKPQSNNNSSTQPQKPKTKLSEYIKKYKTKNTSIGVDVSAWQDDIDWAKAKKDGVEFAMIRIGFGHTSKGEIKEDNWYSNNIKKAKEQGIKVGLYFYSYASNEKEARDQAKWIIKKLNKEKLDLPIAFDWEDWSDFNSYKVSFKTLSSIADAFIDEVNKGGYDGMLYGSAYYLKNIWKSNQNTWLAYYTNNNDYSGKYSMWQLTSSGGVDGISGYVDINVLYK